MGSSAPPTGLGRTDNVTNTHKWQIIKYIVTGCSNTHGRLELVVFPCSLVGNQNSYRYRTDPNQDTREIYMRTLLGAVALLIFTAPVFAQTTPPNIVVIWGDDIGYDNLSAYNHGMMGYQTPNIDRLAKEGALFTDCYGEQSCSAGRAAFILGQHPFRVGLMTIGMPGSDHGIPDWAPTMGDVLKSKGYATAQYGKNHLGDQDKHLPTNHGFDEFFGNLYHLNAEDEPEGYYYPKDPEFKKRFGPRGVIKSFADGKITDTGPLTMKRMETIDTEFLNPALDFV